MYNYTAFSIPAIKFENKFHYITDTISVYSGVKKECDLAAQNG